MNASLLTLEVLQSTVSFLSRLHTRTKMLRMRSFTFEVLQSIRTEDPERRLPVKLPVLQSTISGDNVAADEQLLSAPPTQPNTYTSASIRHTIFLCISIAYVDVYACTDAHHDMTAHCRVRAIDDAKHNFAFRSSALCKPTSVSVSAVVPLPLPPPVPPHPFGGRCLLAAAYCVRAAACWLLLAACGPLPVGYYILSAACCLLRTFCRADPQSRLPE